MTLTVQSLSSLTQDQYDAALALVKQLVQAEHPEIDINGTAIDSILLTPGAILEAANQANVQLAIDSSSFTAINANPALGDAATVANLASNYRVTPLTAQSATGQCTIILSDILLTSIPAGTQFTDPAGNVFVTLIPFTGQVSAGSVVGPSDRLITPVGDGTFSFVIDLSAQNTGPAANIALGTALTPDPTITIVNFVNAFAANDFTGGRDAETIAALISRVQSSWTSRSPSTRAGLEGLIRFQTGFEQIVAISTVGFGDAEEIRNHSILPISLPGRIDSWLRVNPPWLNVELQVTATLTGVDISGFGLWTFTLTRDQGPVYKIDKIALPQNINTSVPGYAITSQTRGFDISAGSTPGTTFLPDIKTPAEAAYSRYMTLSVTFLDTDTNISGLIVGTSTNTYFVKFRSMSGIATLQDVVSARSGRSLVGDCLLKAAVPCFVLPTITIRHPIGSAAVNTAQVQAAVALAINNTGFLGSLPYPVMIAAAGGAIPSASLVTSVTANGNLIRADGTIVPITGGASSLDITSDPPNLVSSRTVCFFSQPSDVTVIVNDVVSPEN